MTRGVRPVVAVALAITCATVTAASAQPDGAPPAPTPAADPLARYFTELEALELIDTAGGNLGALRKDLEVAEGLLRDGAFEPAAVALYAIVKSPRYAALTDFVEFQNAEYDLGVALARAGSYGAALDALEAVLRRGPGAPYFGPAHRRAVDVAIETRDHAGVLARLEAIHTADPIPPSVAGERAYLRGRAAYAAGKLAEAEDQLRTISKQSRLYSSAVYLRGVIRARRGKYRDAADAMCEIAATPDTDRFTFVVDDRYFTVKDLARLGLGRIAHERGEYDDAYYHYFQIPDDSAYLPDALFEAAWSMYQKRELPTARDLVKEFLATFPSSPMWPEASLLAGYVELADCKFDDSQRWYDELVARLQPIVVTIDRARKDRGLRDQLLATAVRRYREVKATGRTHAKQRPATPLDEVQALLRIDPAFVRLSDAIAGVHQLAAGAPRVVRLWQNLGAQVRETKVASVSTERTLEEEQLADANAVVEDLRRLAAQVTAARAELARGVRDGTLPRDVAKAEDDRLTALAARVAKAEHDALAAADQAATEVGARARPSLRPLIEADVAEARRLDRAAHALAAKLDAAGDRLAQAAIERLYADTRRVLDKAKLGKIDAVIGQKRKLDIEVQDLAAGRFPEELIGRMWNASLIGDDEEVWPWEGEFWADEYEGWR